MSKLSHGGQLSVVARNYDIALDKWLDLSTGIAPYSYPIPALDVGLFKQLPQANSDLLLAARTYYGSDSLLVTNGSQSVIERLPLLWRARGLKSQMVYLPRVGYKEHQRAWAQQGFDIELYDNHLPQRDSMPENCVLVIINPNNPTGKLFSRNTLLAYQETIAGLNGLLVIDEAFMDVVTHGHSMSRYVSSTNTLVLRSFGKFFGLAGIRIGFLIAKQFWIDTFSNHFGPWQVNGPAQFIAQVALKDEAWQKRQLELLTCASQQLNGLLSKHFKKTECQSIDGCGLFQTVKYKDDIDLSETYHQLCLLGVYVRLTDERNALRFGIPMLTEFERLDSALAEVIS